MLIENGIASQKGLQRSHIESHSVSLDEKPWKKVEKHKKGRPSVDVGLAQNHRERQDLPSVAQGVDPTLVGAHEEASYSTGSEYVEILLDEEIRANQGTTQRQLNDLGTEAKDNEPPRDYVTGRIISEQGRSCLRCIEKGLRCTLNFVGKETEPRCSACRRSKAQHCVRFRPLDEGGRVIAFEGPPWKNPNFVAYTEDDAVADLSQEELESILREHYQGGRGCYVLGSYIAEKDDVHNFTLPRFHCADKTTLAERPENQKGRDWKDILPVWQNQSLLSQQAKEKKHAVAGEMERRNGRDEISLFRALRRYEPREHHLRDAQGET